jgi:hypothetical protein
VRRSWAKVAGAPKVPNERIREHAERLLSGPVTRRDLALGFSEGSASSAEVLVEGRSFYPRMLDDIASAASSVHINQFGFRPGVVGDAFAEALVRKAAEGVRVRLVVDRQGSDPERASRALYDRLTAAGVQVRVVRATQLRAPSGSFGDQGRSRWNLAGLGHIDHRKIMVVDGRTAWVGGAGIEDHFQDGRFHDIFVRVTGPVVSQLQLVFLASFRWLGGEVSVAELDALLPSLEAGSDPIPALVLHNAPGRYRPITEAIARLLESAVETLDVVNPYVTDRGMIRRIEEAARRGVRVRLSFLGTPTTGPAPPRSSTTTGSSSMLGSASSSTRPCCTRKPSCATARSCSQGRATSRRGASSASSRSMFSSGRRLLRPSSTSGSAPRPRRSRLRVDGSPGRRSKSGRERSPSSRRCSNPVAFIPSG